MRAPPGGLGLLIPAERDTVGSCPIRLVNALPNSKLADRPALNHFQTGAFPNPMSVLLNIRVLMLKAVNRLSLVVPEAETITTEGVMFTTLFWRNATVVRCVNTARAILSE